MLSNEDIYTGPNDPTATINPKIIGAFYINTKTAKLFICTNNSINKNIWTICNPDIKIPDPVMTFDSNWKYKKYSLIKQLNYVYTNNNKYPSWALFYSGRLKYQQTSIACGVWKIGDTYEYKSYRSWSFDDIPFSSTNWVLLPIGGSIIIPPGYYLGIGSYGTNINSGDLLFSILERT